METQDAGVKMVPLYDLISQAEARDLISYIKGIRHNCELVGSRKPSVINLTLKWLDLNPKVTERFYLNKVIKQFGAYLLIFYLELDSIE